MQPTEDPALELALRLRDLRQSALGKKITQKELADALDRSPALISSWERQRDPVTPPEDQLAEYATFFCTPRSTAGDPYRVLADKELNDRERAARKVLRDELLALRAKATEPNGASPLDTLVGKGPWFFPEFEEDEPIVIVCPELPDEALEGIPHAQPSDFDYSELSRLTDLDALFELHGHIRAVNPDVRVEYRSVRRMRRDDSTGHLVVLGGVDWNRAQWDFMRRIDAPVEQISENDPLRRGCFRVIDDQTRSFPPVIAAKNGADILVEDVGYFFRGSNPFNQNRTVTLCNGMFGRGVLGTVRSLTDKKLRDGNAEYISKTFGDADSYSILFRVPIIDERVVVTPDWTAPGTVLHTWWKQSV